MEIADGWIPRLERMFSAIGSSRVRTEQEPLAPAPGSNLAADDKAFPPLPTSTLAYHGLLTAVEHLDFFWAS